MLFVVKAVDAQGNAIITEPLTRKRAVMKVWELKTSGCVRIQSFDANTDEPVDLMQKPDDGPAT
jgi:hypothetical protein